MTELGPNFGTSMGGGGDRVALAMAFVFFAVCIFAAYLIVTSAHTNHEPQYRCKDFHFEWRQDNHSYWQPVPGAAPCKLGES